MVIMITILRKSHDLYNNQNHDKCLFFVKNLCKYVIENIVSIVYNIVFNFLYVLFFLRYSNFSMIHYYEWLKQPCITWC